MLCGLEIIQKRFTDDQLLFLYHLCTHIGFCSQNDFACISARNAVRRVSYLTEEIKCSNEVEMFDFLFSFFMLSSKKFFNFLSHAENVS